MTFKERGRRYVVDNALNQINKWCSPLARHGHQKAVDAIRIHLAKIADEEAKIRKSNRTHETEAAPGR